MHHFFPIFSKGYEYLSMREKRMKRVFLPYALVLVLTLVPVTGVLGAGSSSGSAGEDPGAPPPPEEFRLAGSGGGNGGELGATGDPEDIWGGEKSSPVGDGQGSQNDEDVPIWEQILGLIMQWPWLPR